MRTAARHHVAREELFCNPATHANADCLGPLPVPQPHRAKAWMNGPVSTEHGVRDDGDGLKRYAFQVVHDRVARFVNRGAPPVPD